MAEAGGGGGSSSTTPLEGDCDTCWPSTTLLLSPLLQLLPSLSGGVRSDGGFSSVST